MEETANNVWPTVFLLALLLLTLPVPSHADETEGCDVVAVVAIHDGGPDGLSVSLALVTEDFVESKTVANLPGAAVPQPECGSDLSRCPLKCEAESGLCQFPVRNGTDNFLALFHFGPSSDGTGFRLKQKKLVPPVTASCVPLLVFKTGPGTPVENLVPCLDMTTYNFLYLETLRASVANLTNSSLETDNRVSSEYLPVDGTPSSLLYGDGVKNGGSCSPPHNVFVKIGPKLHVIRIFSHRAEFPRAEAKINSCPFVENFEFFEPDQLRVQCSPTDLVFYDACGSEDVEERLDLTVNATVFQCPDADLNIYHWQGNLTVDVYGSGNLVSGVILPFNDTSTGKCVGAHSPVLFLARSSGETHLLDLSTGELRFVAADTCGPYSCLDLSVLERQGHLVVGVFDYSNDSYLVLDFTCPSSGPVVSHVFFPGPPARVTLMASGHTQSCPPCNNRGPPATPPGPPTSLTPSMPASKPTLNKNATTEKPTINTPDRGSSLALRSEVIGATSGTIAIVLLLGVAMVSAAFVLAFIVHRKRNRRFQPPPPPASPNDDTAAEPNCVPREAADVGGAEAMVSPSSAEERTRYGPEQVVGNFAGRGEGENNANNLLQKVLAFEESDV